MTHPSSFPTRAALWLTRDHGFRTGCVLGYRKWWKSSPSNQT
jgi:hypothetical protein